jgi:hypothetical protein
VDCERNRIQLSLLQGKLPKELERYEQPLVGVQPRRPLWEHQLAMFRHGVTVRRGIWAAEPGCGKTLAAIELMEWAADNLGYTDWWFLSPKNVQKAIELELEKWGCRVKPRLLHYDILARELEARFVCRGCGSILVESRTRNPQTGDLECRECRATGRGIFERLPDQKAPHGVIADESATLKSGGARRTKAVQILADAVREEHDGFVIEMCGIPAPRDPCDWHAQAEIACPGFLREGTRGKLLNRLAVIEKVQLETHAFPKIKSWKRDEVELLKRRLSGLVQIHLASECLDLPELRKEIVKLLPSDAARRAAKLMVTTSLTAVQALIKVRCLSDGFTYLADGSARRAESPKDQALRDLLGRYEEVGRVIVYSAFQESVDRCTEICREEGWTVLQCDGRGYRVEGASEGWDEKRLLLEMDRQADTGEIEKLAYVANPASGGVGLTLTSAPASIFVSCDFNYGVLGQALCRGHRPGMDVERGHTAWFIQHLPTDAYILKNLEQKRELQSWSLLEIQEALDAS